MRGSSCADAGVSLAGTILLALDQKAEVQLVALDVEGAFDQAGVLSGGGAGGAFAPPWEFCSDSESIQVF